MRKSRWIVVLTLAILLLGTVFSPASLAERQRLRVVKFDGVVLGRPPVVDGEDPTLLGEWVIDDEGEEWIVEIVDRTTVIEAHGDLKVGAQVEVVAYETEDGYVAIVVRVVDPEPRVLFVKGFVSELGEDGDDDGDGPDYMVVDGREILITERTLIVPSGRRELEVGDLVHVLVRAYGDELTAWHIAVLPLPQTATIVMRGRVEELVPDESLVLHGITIYITEDTVVDNEELLAVDAYVKVKAQVVREEGSLPRFEALRITVYPEPEDTEAEETVEGEGAPVPAGAAGFTDLR